MATTKKKTSSSKAGANKARAAKVVAGKSPSAAKKPAKKVASKKQAPGGAAAVKKKPATKNKPAVTKSVTARPGPDDSPADELTSLRAELTREKSARIEADGQIADLHDQLDDITNQSATTTRKSVDLEEQLSQIEAAHGATVLRANELEEQLAALESGIGTAADEARKQLEEARKQLEEARKQLDEANRKTADSGAKQDRELFDARARLEREVAIHAATRKQRDTRVAQLEAELVELKHTVTELRSIGPAGKLVCPRCKGKMIEVDHLGVTIDRCTQCEGLYFDAGELEEVVRAEYPEVNAELEAEPAGEQSDGAWGDEDTLVEGPRGRRRGFFSSLFRRD